MKSVSVRTTECMLCMHIPNGLNIDKFKGFKNSL